MKRMITCLPLVVMTTVIISACGQTGPSVVGSTAEAQQTDISDAKSSTTENNDKDIKVWDHSEMPVSLEYDRMWEYSSSADTKDPELISDIVGAIKQLSVGDETEIMTTDLTDVLNFEFELPHMNFFLLLFVFGLLLLFLFDILLFLP